MSYKNFAEGWIILDRAIRDHWVYSEKPYSRFKAWVDLILSANFRDKTIMVNGKPFPVRRGSFLTSVRKLSERWGWSKDKTSRFLATLREEGMIETATPNGTLITVVNYRVYQDKRDRKSDTNRTSAGHRPDRDQSQEKERIKNAKERRKESVSENDDDDDGMSMEEYDRMREAERNGTV